MSILNIIIIFIVFCLAWIITNMINQVIIGKMQQQLQQRRIDAAYVQVSKLVIRTIAELKVKERVRHD